jgi:hypothetical protein
MRTTEQIKKNYMAENIDLYAFYIVTTNDGSGESAHGPYTMTEAESLVQAHEKITTGKSLANLRQQSVLINGKEEAPSKSPNHEKMLHEIRNWGLTLLVIGVIQIFSSGFLSNTWGILLVIVGLASFYFRSSAMFVVYGTTLSWAAISNALGSSGGWFAFSVLQAFFAFQTFRQFFRFRSILPFPQPLENEDEQYKQLNSDKATKPFPWLSFVFGLVSFVGLIAVFLGAIIFVGITEGTELPSFITFSEGLVIDLAVIGFATGLASILSRFKHKLFSIIGMSASALVLVIEVGLNLLG